MFQRLIKPFGFLAVIVLSGFFVSCQQEDNVSDVDNFTLQSMLGLEDECGAGRHGCYELVFPVTIQFSDSTTTEVGSYEELKQAIREWYQANGGKPRPWHHPTLVLPIQVINDAGEVITVETREELRELRELCHASLGGNGGHGGGHHGDGGPCFTLVFPVTLQFADSTQVTVNSKEEMRQAIHTWKENHPDQKARPEFVFPITVALRDGTEVIINSREELRALKEDCRG